VWNAVEVSRTERPERFRGRDMVSSDWIVRLDKRSVNLFVYLAFLQSSLRHVRDSKFSENIKI
jgi:hypothetical protein